jgi:pimeloyl-ACP methyl ester carboxylesterase
MRVDRITAKGGAGIAVHSVGTGPGIVILHGGGVMERDYRRLAQALSDRFTVHLYNRRGRPDSAPLDGTETVTTDIDDLAAVLEHTGARNVFGHSGGGFVALRAGLSLPLERIAVYDPGVSILGYPRAPTSTSSRRRYAQVTTRSRWP